MDRGTYTQWTEEHTHNGQRNIHTIDRGTYTQWTEEHTHN